MSILFEYSEATPNRASFGPKNGNRYEISGIVQLHSSQESITVGGGGGEGSVLTAYIVEFRSCVSLFHSLVKLRANKEKLLSKHYGIIACRCFPVCPRRKTLMVPFKQRTFHADKRCIPQEN